MCGILGLIIPDKNAFQKAFIGLLELQHRGQESAGISIMLDVGKLKTFKGIGLVNDVLSKYLDQNITGYSAIAHTRYSTTGKLLLANAQPIQGNDGDAEISLAHNGNIINRDTISEYVNNNNGDSDSISDTVVLSRMLCQLYPELPLEKRIAKVMHLLKGAYNLVLLKANKLIAVRDPWGFRPLVYGQFKQGGYAVASEVGSLNALGCININEIQPGEIYIFEKDKVDVINSIMPSKILALCTFEHIYFSREDNIWDGLRVSDVRFRLGQELAIESPIEADFITAVPTTAENAARGFAETAKQKYLEIIRVNKSLGRTFIQPDTYDQIESAKNKYHIDTASVEGKHIVLVDDSLVRGTTMKILVDSLRQAGAAKIHARIASPPMLHPCFMGINISGYKELIAAHHNLGEIQKVLNVDSLEYLTIEGMTRAIGSRNSYCNACFTGKYPFQLIDDGLM